MCRLAAVTSKEYISPMEPVLALETMKEGHDGAGLGLVLKSLGGEFGKLKKYPVLYRRRCYQQIVSSPSSPVPILMAFSMTLTNCRHETVAIAAFNISDVCH